MPAQLRNWQTTLTRQPPVPPTIQSPRMGVRQFYRRIPNAAEVQGRCHASPRVNTEHHDSHQKAGAIRAHNLVADQDHIVPLGTGNLYAVDFNGNDVGAVGLNHEHRMAVDGELEWKHESAINDTEPYSVAHLDRERLYSRTGAAVQEQLAERKCPHPCAVQVDGLRLEDLPHALDEELVLALVRPVGVEQDELPIVEVCVHLVRAFLWVYDECALHCGPDAKIGEICMRVVPICARVVPNAEVVRKYGIWLDGALHKACHTIHKPLFAVLETMHVESDRCLEVISNFNHQAVSTIDVDRWSHDLPVDTGDPLLDPVNVGTKLRQVEGVPHNAGTGEENFASHTNQDKRCPVG
mmetsp:Transcript_119663/g.338771  ORF Transcript_119663/g.338771 Transcript_119663/m.338771 type:complete len:353 (+) Transcript_119663:1965-3023(+)